MDKNEQKNPPLMLFMAAALAPVVAFALANALFLPLVLGMEDFGDSFLVNLIPSNIPGSGYLMAVVLVLLFPITAAAVLVGPALTSFIVNLIFPILTNWPRAIWCGVVFFFIHLILLIILLVFRNIPLFPKPEANYPFPTPAIDPLAIAGLLAGFVLSCSVTIFGWLGARMRRKKL
ncbi:MAG TPA: hypothetical protein VII97_09975 [Anaerolineales bacterium]